MHGRAVRFLGWASAGTSIGVRELVDGCSGELGWGRPNANVGGLFSQSISVIIDGSIHDSRFKTGQ